jgi:hypothetical protein
MIVAEAMEIGAAIFQRVLFAAVQPVFHRPDHLGLAVRSELDDWLMPVMDGDLVGNSAGNPLDHLLERLMDFVYFGHFQASVGCPDIPPPQIPVLVVETPEILRWLCMLALKS